VKDEGRKMRGRKMRGRKKWAEVWRMKDGG
jgi:hypothetical protein